MKSGVIVDAEGSEREVSSRPEERESTEALSGVVSEDVIEEASEICVVASSGNVDVSAVVSLVSEVRASVGSNSVVLVAGVSVAASCSAESREDSVVVVVSFVGSSVVITVDEEEVSVVSWRVVTPTRARGAGVVRA